VKEKQTKELFFMSASLLGLIAVSFLAFSREKRRAWFMKEFGASCQDCGRKWDDGWMLEYDHITPVYLGGCNDLENADLLCLFCHLTKHEDAGEKGASNLIRHRLEKTGGKRRGWG